MVGMGAVVASVATVTSGATVATVASGATVATVASGVVFFVTGANTTVTAVVDTCPALEARRVGASKGDTAIPLVHKAPILFVQLRINLSPRHAVGGLNLYEALVVRF